MMEPGTGVRRGQNIEAKKAPAGLAVIAAICLAAWAVVAFGPGGGQRASGMPPGVPGLVGYDRLPPEAVQECAYEPPSPELPEIGRAHV